MRGYSITAMWVAVGAAGLGAAAAAGAQEAPATAACGSLLRRDVLPRAMTDSMLRQRAIVELRRVETIRAASAASGGVGGSVAAGTIATEGSGRVRLLGSRGWLGVQASELSETHLTSEGRVVRYCDYPVVVTVDAGSPAARAGLEAGDTIVAYNGADLRASGEIALDRLLVPDDTLRVGVRRGGRAMILPVVVGRAPGGGTLQALTANGPGFSYVIVNGAEAPEPPLPATAPSAPYPVANGRLGRARVASRPAEAPTAGVAARGTYVVSGQPMLFSFGLGGAAALAGAQVVAMDDDLRAVVGAKSAGVLVIRVAEGTPAAAAGLRSGDVILTANGTEVGVPSILQRAMLRAADERAVSLRVTRQGKTRDVSLRW